MAWLVCHGGEGELTQLTCGLVSFDHVAGQQLLALLPKVLQIDTSPDTNQGWLAALRDKQIGRAMTAIHREPEKAWSVATLAKEARMSRSGFSARFTQLVGDSAMRYLTRWRMQLARSELAEGSVPLILLAKRLGYQSEAAFCRAFKREFGLSPGSVRDSTSIHNESVISS
jgi:AraC-like DNA-binding protein